MSRLSDYIAQVSGLPEAPSDGFTYGRRGQDASWQVTYNKAEADLEFAPIVHTHPYVGLTGNESIDGQKTFNERAAIGGVAIDGSYGLNIAGSVNLSSGSNYFVNGNPIETFVDAPSDGNTYGRNNGGWVEVSSGGGGTISNLSMSYFSTYVTIVNSGGQDANINAATTSLAGLMTASDKTALNNALVNGDVDLSISVGTSTATVSNTAGDGFVIPNATDSKAGLMTASEHEKLGDLAPGGGVDLGTSYGSTSVTVTNTGGNNAVLNQASDSQAGIMSAQRKQYCDAAQSDRIVGLDYTSTSVKLVKVNSPDSTINVTIAQANSSNAGVMPATSVQQLAGLTKVAAALIQDLFDRGKINATDRDDALALVT